ncbi:tyrosine-type recombinase/integrase [Wenzhouxiangella sp. EGI_FJ10409]|uniref:tyrosine-type recombinase/integrase n=1 Tax=Wenzhouxiangella sp. EGI_FJ10409 TaxID=3243767 RepID=UPI0035D8F76D
MKKEAKKKINITNTTVGNLEKPQEGYELHWDDDLSGFGVRVTAAGARSYIAEGRVNGKTCRVTIGKHGTFTAEQARKIAKGELGGMAQGVNPNAERKRLKVESQTLADLVRDYLENRRTRGGKALKDRTKADIRRHLKTSFADWADRPVTAITHDMVTARYSALCRRSVAQANQAMRNLRALIDYASASRDADNKPIISYNPVEVLKKRSLWREVPARQSKVDREDLGRWWSAVQAMRADPGLTRSSRSAVDLVAFIALTGLRLSEARSLTWDQVCLEDPSVTLTDTKNRADAILPLSDLAVDILRNRQGTGYLFPARSGKGHLVDARGQLELIAEQTGVRVTHHDLRRTFIQIGLKYLPGEERIEIFRVKLLSNHALPKNDVTLASYANDPDRRFLKPEADRIAAFYEDQRRIFEADNVVSMEGKRA